MALVPRAEVHVIAQTAPAATPATAEGVDSPRAWLVVAATFLATSTAFFITYSFTTFFTEMAATFGSNSASTSTLFSLTIFFLFVLGLPAGRIADRIGPRPVMAVGAVVLVSGLFLTSAVSRIEYGYLTYGLGVGFGVACCYVPVIAQVTGWFDRHRATALGIASAGIGVGTILGPPVSQALIDATDWRVTYRILGVAAAVGFSLAIILVRGAPGLVSAEPPKLRGLFGDPVFRAMYFSGFLMTIGLFVPFVYLKPYAELKGISPGTAATLVSALGVGSLLGRLLLGAIAGPLGLMRLYQLCFVTVAGSFLIWLAAGSNVWALGAFMFVLGTAYGGYVALSPAAAAHLFGLDGLGGKIGAMYTAGGVGGLISAPAAGALIDRTDGYTSTIVLAFVVSTAGMLVLRRALSLSENTAGGRQSATTS